MASTDDPITQVHDALLALLTAHTGLATIFGQAAMTQPQFRLEPKAGFLHTIQSSNQTALTKTWILRMECGDQDVTDELFPYEWRVACALNNWPATFAALTWSGNAGFPIALRTQAIETRIASEGRGIRGWIDLVQIDVEMHFTNASMRAAITA